MEGLRWTSDEGHPQRDHFATQSSLQENPAQRLFHCTRLHNLIETNDGPEPLFALADQRRLVRDNPGLKLLHWSGGSSFPRLDADDFSNLHNLKALQLICWDASDMRLFDVLKLVSGSLTSFGCRFLTGVRPEDLSPPKVDHDVDSEAEERLSFPSLADVAANFFDVARAAFEGRAYRPYVIGIQEQGDLLWNCPQLETLSLTLPTNTNI
ncbi:hypothetical protein BGX29_004142 [Mortierella sp. GBA35]|nr:hypothetical protein BGX29_004142 [Mortierella sp. GBA35]